VAVNEFAEIVLRQEAEHPVAEPQRLRRRSLVVTTVGYIGCFAVWTIFAIIRVV
jgi:nitrate/nitrite transporter NarK